jgi:hypothetical protein
VCVRFPQSYSRYFHRCIVELLVKDKGYSHYITQHLHVRFFLAAEKY